MRTELAGARSTATLMITVVLSLAVGAGVMYWVMRTAGERDAPPQQTVASPADEMANIPGMGAPAAPPVPASGAVVVSLSREAVERAGIVVTPVNTGVTAAALRIPGVVEPNAYGEVVVTPVASGRVTRVNVQLGAEVRRGQTLAQIYSSELADVQTRYLSAQADLEAAAQQLRRTERLVEIGAASRQELESVRADHTTRATAVQAARSQLVLLGMNAGAIKTLSAPSEITAITNVPAPIDGVITERSANIGLNVDPATKLFTVVDLSTVWVVGDLYERDFRRIQVGTAANITTAAYPDTVLRGKVSYIDPEVNPETRTARVRVEMRNPDRRLRLGMFADMEMNEADEVRVVLVPKDAVQTLGDRTVIYVVDANQQGQFVEREVTVGNTSGENVEVLAGVKPGEVVVAQGSFFVRAERERVNPSGATAPARSAEATLKPQQQSASAPTVKITERGFEPDRVTVAQRGSAEVAFVRTTDATCAKEVVIPSLNIKRALPLNQPVTIALKPDSGGVGFVCGMNMFKGTVIVR